MGNVIAKLYNSNNTIIATDTTDPNGTYTFNNIPSGSYTVKFSTSSQPGGINLTDAFTVMLHLLGLYPFDNIKTLAADVTGNGTVTWDDYFYILINYLNQGNPFPTGPWVFENVTTTPGARTGTNSGGSSSGDVNGTFIPTKSDYSVKAMNPVEDHIIGLNDVIPIPVSSPYPVGIGGMHLVIDIPSGLTITNVESLLEDSLGYTIDGQHLRITWMDTCVSKMDSTAKGYELEAGRPFITVMAKADNLSTAKTNYVFRLSEESHFMDNRGESIQGMSLMMPSLNLQLKESIALSVYPNPFFDHSTIGFNVPEEGQVVVRLYDSNGRLVSEIENTTITEGIHQTVIDGTGLMAGVYFYSVSFKGENNYIKTGSIIKSK